MMFSDGGKSFSIAVLISATVISDRIRSSIGVPFIGDRSASHVVLVQFCTVVERRCGDI